jgi:hypothetical protein
MALPKTETELQHFIADFESGTLPKHEWHHAKHVAVAFWYLSHLDEKSAIDKIRSVIKNLNSKHGVLQTPTGGYHETWTIFFSILLNRYNKQDSIKKLSPIEQMNSAIQYLTDFREVTRQYFSRDLIMSWEARTAWREPNLMPL